MTNINKAVLAGISMGLNHTTIENTTRYVSRMSKTALKEFEYFYLYGTAPSKSTRIELRSAVLECYLEQ